jgi:hypothetical protein
MKTSQLLLIISFFSFTVNAYSQAIYRAGLIGDNFATASRGENRAIDFNSEFVSKMVKDEIIDENIDGSRYFNETFLASKILYQGVSYPKMYLARYNAFEDLIELRKGEQTDALLKDENISCMIDGSLYVYQPYSIKKGKDTQLGYLKLLYTNSNISLYLQQHIKFKEAVVAKSSMSGSFPAKFVPSQTFYYRTLDTEAAIPINKKTVLTVFSQLDKGQIKSYIKDNKIDISNEADLIKLFKYYASLL